MGITRANRYRLKDKRKFIPGLVLNEGYFHEIIQPILNVHMPGLRYDAALTGPCSDALGFDTYISMDHYWGPRAQIFIAEDESPSIAVEIKSVLSQNLPRDYRGFPTNWNFDRPDHGARPEFSPDGQINPYVEVKTVPEFVQGELRITYPGPISAKDWLAFPEQELMHLTTGRVFHSGLGALDEMRTVFQYYPHDVWLFKMRAIWNSIAEEQAFMGRCHDVGDELGERLIATRITNKLMKLCFALEKTYYPYSKWFGTGFSRLQSAKEIGPTLQKVLSAASHRRREQALCEASLLVIQKHNALNITAPLPLEISDYYLRGYRGYQNDLVGNALTAAISPNFWRDLGIDDPDSCESRIWGIEPLLDDSNYARNPEILQRITVR
jgi:hypothetical protein